MADWIVSIAQIGFGALLTYGIQLAMSARQERRASRKEHMGRLRTALHALLSAETKRSLLLTSPAAAGPVPRWTNFEIQGYEVLSRVIEDAGAEVLAVLLLEGVPLDLSSSVTAVVDTAGQCSVLRSAGQTPMQEWEPKFGRYMAAVRDLGRTFHQILVSEESSPSK
jgi:hypothetical protein